MKILGIESSCDETGVALVELDAHGRITLRGEALHSQAQMHEAYGGVVPELASRDHIRHLLPLTREVLVQAACTVQDIELVAYTRGPGLAGALLVGAGMAVALAAALARPALGIHHLEGHLLSPFLADDPPEFPFVALLVSGGHTQLMQVEGVGRYVLLGETIDDAAGEAFDKSAKLLGLGYPGGPELARLAATGQAGAYTLPRPLLHSGNLDFSFAGLKTAMMLKARAIDATFDAAFDVDASCIDQHRQRADLAAALQEAIVDVLVAKSLRALLQSGSKRLVVAGGVGANQRLREQLSARAAKQGARVYYPPLHLCSDNGAMIAGAAALRVRAGLGGGTRTGAFDVRPRWPLGDLGDLNDLDRLDDQDQPGVLTPKIS